jgi:hypothetical protein
LFTILSYFCTLPAFIKSASSFPSAGYGPTPNTPFSLCKFIFTYGGRTLGSNVGIPIPRLTFIPFFTYFAALLIIFNRVYISFDFDVLFDCWCYLLIFLIIFFYIFF